MLSVYLKTKKHLHSLLSIRALSTATNTILVPGGTTRAVITGIEAGTKVTVQVFAQNSAGRSALSTAVSTYVIC